jgi:hypothetical protein
MEFYIRDVGDPNFDQNKLEAGSEIAQLLTQIETLLFTRKGDVMGEPNFGANLDDLVYALRYNDRMIASTIEDQLETFVPLSRKYNTRVNVDFTEEVDRHLLFVNIDIDSKYQVGVYI